MRTINLVAVTLLLFAVSAANAQRRDVLISATVERVERGSFPEVTLRLAEVTSSPKGAIGTVVTVSPYYVRDGKGRPYFHAAPTTANLAAYYLLPGDKITGRLMAKMASKYVHSITDLKRVPCGPPPKRDTSKRIMELKTNLREYAPGKPVLMEFTARNPTDEPIEYTFSSGQQFDFWVYHGKTEVWRWSHDRFFIQAFTHLNLAPGESKTFSASWNQMDNKGKPVSAGSYLVKAQLTTVGEREQALFSQIKILPSSR